MIDFAIEMKKLWNIKATGTLFDVGAFEMVPKSHEKRLR